MTLEVKSPVNRLLRGISSGHVQTTRDAWRDILRGGDAETRAVLEKLDSPAWECKPRGPSGTYFGVLLAVLHELDPEAFRSEVKRLQAIALHPLHRKTLEVLQSRVYDLPIGNIAQNTPVYVSEDINERRQPLDALIEWSKTEGLDLEQVTRVDVIAEDSQQDYLGKYSLYFSGIILVWPEQSKSRLVSWLQELRAEHTFYHEVGHHISGHLEGGSVAEQEQEADAFALKMMCRAYPVLNAGVLLFYFPAKRVEKWLRRCFTRQFKRKRHG